MKKFLIYPAIAVLSLAMATVTTSCSNDDDDNDDNNAVGNVSTTLVFANKYPTKVGSITNIIRNDNGQLISCKFTSANVTFEYDMPHVTMKVNYSGDIDTYVFEIGSNGFAKSVHITENNPYASPKIVEFQYNAEGQLTSHIHTDDYNTWSLTYTYINADLVRAQESYIIFSSGDSSTIAPYTIKYTNASTPTPIVNNSGIAFFDECFYADLDDLILAYYAGMLGRPSAHYPVEHTDEYGTSSFSWGFNAEGYPTSMTKHHATGGVYTIDIRW